MPFLSEASSKQKTLGWLLGAITGGADTRWSLLLIGLRGSGGGGVGGGGELDSFTGVTGSSGVAGLVTGACVVLPPSANEMRDSSRFNPLPVRLPGVVPGDLCSLSLRTRGCED